MNEYSSAILFVFVFKSDFCASICIYICICNCMVTEHSFALLGNSNCLPELNINPIVCLQISFLSRLWLWSALKYKPQYWSIALRVSFHFCLAKPLVGGPFSLFHTIAFQTSHPYSVCRNFLVCQFSFFKNFTITHIFSPNHDIWWSWYHGAFCFRSYMQCTVLKHAK